MNYNGCELKNGALVMPQSNRKVIVFIAVIFVVGLISGLTWANYLFANNYPGGSAFNNYWTGSRLLIDEGKSPYSENIVLKTQTSGQIFGEVNDTKPSRFANPLYSIILYIPFSLVDDYVVARALWMTLLEISLFITALITLRFCKWKTGLAGSIIYMLLAFLAYFSVRALISGDVIILAGLFLCTGIWAILKGEDELAGAMVALTTIKPQFGFLLIIFLIFWTISQQRYKFSLWFFISLSFFVTLTLLIQPGWILEFFQANIQNFGTTGFHNAADMMREIFPGFGSRLGWIISGLIFVVLIFEWTRAKGYDSKRMLWLICVTLVGGALVGLPAPAESLVLLLPAILFLSETILERWKSGSLIIVLSVLGYLFLPWYVVISNLQKSDAGVEKIIVFSVIVFILILLFWNRDWLMSSVRPWFDLLEPQIKTRKK